ncbi:LysR family transcriptional regulator [Paroceanicella profunda]|nr:LysR family transcriptional regulator [Paroceanicella profunda]
MSADSPTDIDLRLLRVLDALLETNSVKQAAALLDVTPSAVSHSLAELRQRTSDPLLVRNGPRLRPTPRAEAMRPLLRAGLTDLYRLIADPVEFTPATSTRRFSLAAPEHIVVGQLPDVLPDLIAEAPKARFEISSVLAPLPELLDSGSLDLALTTLYADETLKLESAMMRSQLFAERFVCIGRRGHPLLARGCIELAAFLGAPQISIRMPGARTSPTDTALENEGLARHVALTLGSAHAAAQYVGNSDLLAMVPYSVAARGEALGRLTCVAPPIKLPPVTGMLWWSNRLHSDPAHRWWREKLGRLLQPINYGDRSN